MRCVASVLLALGTALQAGEDPVPRLLRIIRKAPASPDAEYAIGELGALGKKGYIGLGKVVSEMTRKGLPEVAERAVKGLASGDEEDRYDVLKRIYRSVRDDQARSVIALGLARWYPQGDKVLHARLRSDARGRRELLRKLGKVLPVSLLEELRTDPVVGDTARTVLKARGWGIAVDARFDEASKAARTSLLLSGTREVASRLRRDWNPRMLLAVALLLSSEEEAIRTGAHLLLLSVSGKDMPPDPDIWRSWITANPSAPPPPGKTSKGLVAAAVLRGVRYLKWDLAKDGLCVWKPTRRFNNKVIGATALAVVALRASGVPREDPVLRKAVHKTLLFGSGAGAYSLQPELGGYVYGLSLVAMALSRMDPKLYRVQIQACASALARGQLPNGRWTYYVSGTDRRPGDPNGDNSNTQYAILGLRAARRVGAKDRSWRRHLSMTSAGVGSLAICLEGLHGGAKASEIIAKDHAMRRGLASLGFLLLRRKVKGYGDEELYVYYGVERAGVLTQVRAFEEFDWYAEGVKRLLASQTDDGSWGTPGASGIAKGRGYGPAVDTCYALLFLKRATATVGPPRDQQIVRVPLTKAGLR
ncbi:MAG: prenyltransferase/squalene oxidase repeat-containing protein [Planctomycetota bacterium]|jgi:hypothetical protein